MSDRSETLVRICRIGRGHGVDRGDRLSSDAGMRSLQLRTTNDEATAPGV